MPMKEHWEHVYQTEATTAVSWFQPHADRSLRLIAATGVGHGGAVIDVGGGASTLVDDLLDQGYRDLTVLDLSAAVRWLEADVTDARLRAHRFDVWHDRAVFHFLTAPADRAAYVRTVRDAVKPGGHVIVATFADDGPTQCSGLPVMRYRADELHGEFGGAFELLRQEREVHATPFGTEQRFLYCYCRLATD